jgi:hypothetical protein
MNPILLGVDSILLFHFSYFCHTCRKSKIPRAEWENLVSYIEVQISRIRESRKKLMEELEGVKKGGGLIEREKRLEKGLGGVDLIIALW